MAVKAATSSSGAAMATRLMAATGTDALTYAHLTSGVVATLSGVADDTVSGIENLIGSDYADTLTGDANANVISGGAGNDTLRGNGGADTLNGGDGSDLIQGGADGDTIDGGSGTDTVSYAHLGSAVTATLGGSGDDTISGVENLTGSGLADTLTGDNAANVISGGAGNDTLRGNGGADTLNGGDGGDLIQGGADGDTIDGGSGTDTVSYAHLGVGVSATLGGTGDDNITGVENLNGTDFDDTLIGDSGNNVIVGGDGNDTIVSGGGRDFLSAGAGDDTFTLDEAMLNIAGTSVDGGTGTDVAGFTAGTYDEDEVSGVIYNIEELDFTGAGVIADLELSSADIIAMTDAFSKLAITGNTGDSITVTDSVDNMNVNTDIPDTTIYSIFDDNTKTTQIAELTVTMVA